MFCVFCIAAFFSLCVLFIPKHRDIAACLRVKAAKKAPSVLSSSTHQHRRGVRKELWLVDAEGNRLHHKVYSTSSVLMLEPKGPRIELMEKLQGVECLIQDRANSSAELRLLRADEGLYSYRDLSFLAHSVAVSLFRLPEGEIPENIDVLSPFLQGIAQDVRFSVSSEGPQFSAQRFKASMVSRS